MFDHDAVFLKTKFVGNVCYGRLTDQIRVKISFQTGTVSEHYDRLKVMLLNRNEGIIDSVVLKFEDLWGRKLVRNPNFPNGVSPHIWRDRENIDWYVYHPTKTDYQQVASAVRTYLEVFQEPAEEQQPEQTMY